MPYSEQFGKFVSSALSSSDYIFVDPPWNYPQSRYKSEFWNGASYSDVFRHFKSSFLFIYTSVDKLPQMLCAQLDSMYEFVALIPYITVANHEDATYALQNAFRNSLQYIAVFQTTNAVTVPELPKMVAMEYANTFLRPVVWEDKMFNLLSSKGLRGVYILPTGEVGDTTPVSSSNSTISKKELF